MKVNKLFLLFDLFRKGSVVADPALIKNRAALVLVLTPALLAATKVAKAYGYEVPLADEDVAALAAGIAVVVGLFSTYATSDKVGLPAKQSLNNKLQTNIEFDQKSENDLRGGP